MADAKSALTAQMTALKHENKRLEDENRVLTAENARLKELLEGTSLATVAATVQSQHLARYNQHLEAALQVSNTARLNEHSKELEDQQAELDRIQADFSVLQANHATLTADNAALHARNKKLETENSQLRTQINQLKLDVESLSAKVEAITCQLAAHKEVLLNREAANKIHEQLARKLWSAGTKPPYRLLTLRQQLQFLKDMRAKTSPSGYCGDKAHEAFQKLSASEQDEIFGNLEKLNTAAKAIGIDNLFDSTEVLISLRDKATLTAHPIKGKWASCHLQVYAALSAALQSAEQALASAGAEEDRDDDQDEDEEREELALVKALKEAQRLYSLAVETL
jgi:hypothetical protein